MLRNSILVVAGLAAAAGVLVATPQNASARHRCWRGGYYGGYYGSSYYGSSAYYGGSTANPQTYDGTAPAPAPADGAVPYGTNYGPQGGNSGAPGAQGYYDNAGRWRASGAAAAAAVGGAAAVDAQGRPINQNQVNPNQVNPRANTGVREDGSTRTNIQANPGNGTSRNSTGTGRKHTNVNGHVRSSTGANVPPPPPASTPSTPVTPSTPPREE
jgi:hypothetical protein